MQSIIAASLYGILSIIGGIIGYKSAGSKVSLISGTVSGLLLLVAAYLQLQGQTWGLTISLILTSILVVVFAVRLGKTRKFMPAGLMVFLGLAALIAMFSQLVFSA
ncbi:TMEM14 family protein [Calothrix sp. CCY 0018]|uniref:TMEM14 family protein n=1 Tax=Calothrix sp. CCY 0018 TaxID=3103864 RepID=UPI0039C66CEF